MTQRYSVSREFHGTGQSALNMNLLTAIVAVITSLLDGAVKVTVRKQTNTPKPVKAEDYGFAAAGVLR